LDDNKTLKDNLHFLLGFITLPKDSESKTIFLEISTVPCSEDLLLHPHLLHLTVFGVNSKRTLYKTPLNSPSDWRLKFKIVNCKKLYHVPNNPNETEIPLADHFVSYERGQPRLLLGKGNILINIIASLQNNSKNEKKGFEPLITNLDVISRRFLEEQNRYPELSTPAADFDFVKNLASKYTAKEYKIELHRCRLRALLCDPIFPQNSRVAYSSNINNARDKNVGHLNPRSINDPGMCCTEGGWRFFLVSEHKLSRDRTTGKQEMDNDAMAEQTHPVIPRLELTDKNMKIVPFTDCQLNQVSTNPEIFELHGDTFSFVIPPQDPMEIDRIKHLGLQVI